jgi:hypothetical protein
MNHHRVLHRVLVLLVGSLLASGSGRAQTGRPANPSELMSLLKVGQWIKLDGPAGRDPTVLCSEAKMLMGDFIDGDWQITSDVRRVDPAKQTLLVFTLVCRMGDGATFKSASGLFKSLAEVKPGQFVNVEGTYLKDGTFLARKVGDKADELVAKPDHKGHVIVRGRIDRVDPARHSVTVMGITFVITSSTRIKSVIR